MMRKRDVLIALFAVTGGLLMMGEGPMFGAALVAVAGYLLTRSETSSVRKRLTTAVAALAR